MALSPSPVILWLFALLCLHGVIASNEDRSFYAPENVSCHATENFVKIPKRMCAAKCSSKEKGLCIGFGHNETNCELCLVCPTSSNYESLNSDKTTYSSAISFVVEREKG